MDRLVALSRRAAEHQCTVLICGEAGSGKQRLARFIHQHGPRARRAFVPVRCATLSPMLAESQLFGHEAGAMPASEGAALGVLRAADGGIVYLDEVAALPEGVQPKLLGVLRAEQVIPLGSLDAEKVDVQLIAASCRDLADEVARGRFDAQLYELLRTCELRIPPLRERTEDIPELVQFFVEHFAERYQQPARKVDAGTLERLCLYPWPGNVRQLSQTIERAYVLDTVPAPPEPEVAS